MTMVPWWCLLVHVMGLHGHIYRHGKSWNGYGFHTYPHPARRPMVPRDIMVDVINDLGLKLLAIHNEYNENNIAISPYGALSVLIALGEGLVGDAVYEVQQASHLPSDISVIRVGLRDIHRHLKSYFIPKEGFLAGLTLNHENVTLRPEYEEILRFYGYDTATFNNALYPQPETSEVTPTTAEEISTTEPYTTAEVSTTNAVEMTTKSIPESTMNLETTVTEGSTEMAKMLPDTTTNTIISDETTLSVEQISTSALPQTTLEMSTAKEIPTTTTEIITTSLVTEDMTTSSIVSSTTSSPESTTTSTEAVPSTEVPTSTRLTVELEGTTKLTTDLMSTMSTTMQTITSESLTTPYSPTITTEIIGKSDDSSTVDYKESTVSESTIATTQFTDAYSISTAPTITTDLITTTHNPSDITEKDNEVDSVMNSDSATTTEGFGGVSKRKVRSDASKSRKTNMITLNMKNVPLDSSDDFVYRRTRSVVDYLIARYYDDQFNFHNSPGPYIPEDQPSFLIYEKYREYNINFMKYDTVLPFHFAPHLNALALSFPLDSNKYYLLLLLPVDETGIDKLVCDLRLNGSIRYLIENLKYRHVIATIPSFMLRGYVTLTPSFQKLGIRKVFEPRQADFTPMTNQKGIYVTNIEQAITVTIRNYMDSNIQDHRNLHRYDPVHFKADHPFLYFVIDSEINVTLMAGKIVNPLNSRIS